MLRIPFVAKVANGLAEAKADGFSRFIDINELYKKLLFDNVAAGNKSVVEEVILDVMAENQMGSPSGTKLDSLHAFLNEHRDGLGNNLFLLAVQANKIKIVRLLLDYGANLYSRNSCTGRTAFLFAHMNGEAYLSMKVFLLRKRMAARVNYQQSRTILPISAQLEFNTRPAKDKRFDSPVQCEKPENPLTDLQVLMQQKDQYLKAKDAREMSLVTPCQNLSLLSSLWQPFIDVTSVLRDSLLNSLDAASLFFFGQFEK